MFTWCLSILIVYFGVLLSLDLIYECCCIDPIWLLICCAICCGLIGFSWIACLLDIVGYVCWFVYSYCRLVACLLIGVC